MKKDMNVQFIDVHLIIWIFFFGEMYEFVSEFLPPIIYR